MKVNIIRRINFLAVIGLAIIFVGSSAALSYGETAAPTKKIEIVAKDYQLTVESGYTIVGDPTEIIFRNEDDVTHGFNFSLFGEVLVKLVGGGYLAEGMGPHVYRVDPGKMMVLKLTWASKEQPASTTYAFWCDLHLNMDGEMFVVEVKREASR